MSVGAGFRCSGIEATQAADTLQHKLDRRFCVDVVYASGALGAINLGIPLGAMAVA